MTVVAREIIDREEWLGWRQENINASEAAALFGDGVHPYLTAYELWARRSGLIGEDPDTPEKQRGRRLENIAIEILEEERPEWRLKRPRVYLADEEARLGSTPDLYAYRDGLLGTVQIKTVGNWAFAKGWRHPETREIEPPLWIAVQTAVEAHLAGAEWAAIAALTLGDGGLGLHVEEVPLTDAPGIIANLTEKIADFWGRVIAGDPYPIDWNRDLDVVLEVYRDDDGSLVNATDDEEVTALLEQRGLLKLTEAAGAEAKTRRQIIDGKLIARMGNARRLRCGQALIEAATVRRRSYTVAATQYRQVRIKG